MEGETKHCMNCKRDISASNFVMHEMHCKRHIVLCEHCKEPIPRSEIDQHFNDLHAKVACERCKVEISKEKLENHLANECAKKPTHCEYCELSFPKDEFDAHTDYCGSRTECCALCQQYIMLKDMLRHENSGCTYPEPKPPPAPMPSSDPDPFSMEDLQGLLGNSGFMDEIPDFTANLRRELMRGRSQHSTQAENSSSQGGTNHKQKNGKASTGRKAVNVQRDRNTASRDAVEDWNAIPPDMDYDTMLALQLAHDDWGQDDVEENGHEQVQRRRQTGQFNMDDILDRDADWTELIPEVMQDTETQIGTYEEHQIIPCEFCNSEIEMGTYMDHVAVCPLSTMRHDRPSDLNNETPERYQPSSRANIPVINNLHSNSYQRLTESIGGFEEDVELPCEFCEETFPSDMIIQHQSVCQANGLATPRVTTPATGHRNRTPKHNPSSNQNPGSFKPALNSRPRHQPDPNSFGTDGAWQQCPGDNSDEETSNYFRNCNFHQILESSSNKYSPAVDRFDDSVTRPPRRGSRPLSNEDEDTTLNSQTDGRRPNKSAQRIRATLNQLLQEETRAGGSSGAAKRNPTPKVSTQKGRQEAKTRTSGQTTVDSRTVMRELSGAELQRPSRNRPQQGTSSLTSSTIRVEGNTNNHAPGNGRSRQRTDKVFSPELRLKPDHNPPPRKR